MLEFVDDYNRVPLTTGGEREYINASFIEVRSYKHTFQSTRITLTIYDFIIYITVFLPIQGYQEPKKYIAAQGINPLIKWIFIILNCDWLRHIQSGQ